MSDAAGLTASGLDFLSGGGETGRLMRDRDWTSSPLGAPQGWPQSLRLVVGLLLGSKFPMFVAWGEDLGFLYNDAYAEILAAKHPEALGAPFKLIWAEIWPDIAPLIDAALAGEASYRENLPLVTNRHGYEEPTWFTFSYSPVRDESGSVTGVFCAVAETTSVVRTARRRDALLALDDRLRDVADTAELSFAASELLGEALGAARVGYGVIDAAAGAISVERNWSAAGFDSVAGLHAFRDYGSYIDDLRRGDAVANADVTADPRTADRADSFRAIGVRAFLDVPVLESGEAAAMLFVHSATPRAWTEEEIAFVREVAVRTRAAVARRVAEHALRESEALARSRADEVAAIFDAAPVGLCVLDRDLRFMRINERLAEMNGMPAADHVGRAVHELLPNFDGQAVAAMRKVLAGEALLGVEFVGETPAQPGVVRTWRENWLPLRDEAGEIVAVTVSAEEVTAAKRAEKALRESEEFNRRILASSADCIKVLDLDGRIEFLPSGSAAILELADAKEVIGQHWTNLWPQAERGRVLAAIDDAKLGDTARFEGPAPTAKGNPRWWDVLVTPISGAGGEPEKLLAVSRDVTATREVRERLRELNETLEQRVAERTAALSESQRRFQGIFDSAFQFMALLAPDGTVLEVNRTALAWSEIEPGDIVGRPFWLAAPMRENPTLQAAVEDGIRRAARGETVRAEHEMRGAGDVRAIVDFSLKPVGGADGGPLSLVAEGRDITALKEAQDALRQAQKMEAMGQLTGGVAHDFNNLLTPIMGALDMLQRKGIGGERERRLVGGAMQSAERAKVLVQRLLAFARRQPLQPTAVDIGALVRGMAQLVESTTGPQVRVSVEIADDLPAAKADPNQVEMALLNLAVNARDAMPDGGTLRITAGLETIAHRARSKLKPGSYVRLSVADTGAGMDENTLRHAVEPFFSTKGVGKGTGLGLSMVHGLVQQLGGALDIQSRRGMGTNVVLWLPATDAEAEKPSDAGATSPSQATLGTALLVDDEDLVRISTADMLADLGYVVVEAASAERALQLIDGGLRPDLLITDHLMPGMTGTHLARTVRQGRPDLPVLIVSGYAESEGIAPDLPRLTKPFRNEELAASLAQLSAAAIV